MSSNARLRVLLVPESVHWVTGTIAKSIARFNPWIEATIVSGPVIDTIFTEQPQLMRNFDLVHFTCTYASRKWMPRFRELIPCVTSHHHVTDWNLVKHNADGDAIIVGSQEWAEDLSSRGVDPKKVFCVPYGVNAELFHPDDASRTATRQKLGIASGNSVIGFFGKNSSNDDDRKGIDVFTDAVLRLSQRLPELAVLIVGPGWQDLVRHLKSCGVKCIWFQYVADLKGLAGLYRALDFYWVTSRIEGGPVTLLEAMSSQVCCLTTPVGLAREIVRDDCNAVLLPFNDAKSFVDRTVALARDPARRHRIGTNARETILREMDAAVTGRRVKEVYAKALEGFAVRSRVETPPHVRNTIADDAGMDRLDDVERSIPLHGFPVELHRRVRMLETLAWSEHLILYHHQQAVGFKMITKEWLRNPLSLEPGRVFLRRFLPISVVAWVVKLKNRSRGPAQALCAKEHSAVGTRCL
jgi:glycosyltransferase involved in cell wall biosynthesis